MSKASAYINEWHQKKDGTHSIYLVLRHDNQVIRFNTGLSFPLEQYNKNTGRIRGKSKAAKDANLIIENGISFLNDIFVRYRLQREVLTAEILKKEWKNPTIRVNFYEWMEKAIETRSEEIAQSSIKQHYALLSKLKTYKKKLTFAELDVVFIEGFRRYLKNKRKNDLNTIHNNLKNLKAYLNIAINQGIIKKNPFDNIKMKRSAAERIFLTERELKELRELYFSNRIPESYRKVLRHFLFMCFTGIRVSDLRELDVDSVIEKILYFVPVKTKGVKRSGLKINLNKYAMEMIHEEDRKVGKLFDCVSEQKMNVKIKEIVKAVGIRKRITNHCGRHTFATLYLQKTKDVAGLQRILGHSNIGETMIYVHINNEMMNENMLDFEGKLFT